MTAWFPGLTGIIDKGFGGSRGGDPINGVVLHHTANGGGKSALDYVSNANDRNSHPTYLVQTSGAAYGIVNPDRRPYSTAGRPDSEAVSFEVDNASGAPDWAISDAALSKVMEIIAYHYRQSPKWGHGIARNKPGVAQSEFFVAWHSQYVATACPGPHMLSRIDAIIAGALTIANGGAAPAPAGGETATGPSSLDLPPDDVRRIGTFLNGQGLAAFRTAAADDGIPRDPGERYSRYFHLVQLWGTREGVYDDVVDGIPGPNTRATERVLLALLNAPAPEPPAPEPTPTPLPDPEPQPTEPTPEPPLPDPKPEPLPEVPADPEEEQPVPITPPTDAATPPPLPDDVILPRKARGPLLLGSWIAGSLVAITNGAYLAAIAADTSIEYPLWLLIVTIVTGGVSSQVNAVARANLNPPKQ